MFRYIKFALHFANLQFGHYDPLIVELIREENLRARRLSGEVMLLNVEHVSDASLTDENVRKAA